MTDEHEGNWGQLARWIGALSEYDMVIKHRSGTQHANANALSRRRCDQCERMGYDGEAGVIRGVDGANTGDASAGGGSPPGMGTGELSNLRLAQTQNPDLGWIYEVIGNQGGGVFWLGRRLRSDGGHQRVLGDVEPVGNTGRPARRPLGIGPTSGSPVPDATARDTSKRVLRSLARVHHQGIFWTGYGGLAPGAV